MMKWQLNESRISGSHAVFFLFFFKTIIVNGLVSQRNSLGMGSFSSSRQHEVQSRFDQIPLKAVDVDVDTEKSLWQLEELNDFASQCGVTLSFTTLGPGFRTVARAKHNPDLILGYIEGFVRPSGKIFHFDKMEAFQPMLNKARSEKPDAFDFGNIPAGIGIMMGYRCLLFAQEKGCSKAEFLAIDDEDFQHKRLVRYYRTWGFNVVRYVGEDIKNIPDRLIWGGCGTLMNQDIDVLSRKWERLLERMKEKTSC